MEADWDVEIGGDAPVVEVCWPGWIDLRRTPALAATLVETAQFPALGAALVQLNASHSPLSTSKCDVWPVDAFDPDELDAPRDAANQALACYVDLVAVGHEPWTTPESAIDWARCICEELRSCPLACCRADLVVRQAVLGSNERTSLTDNGLARLDVAVTAYLTACGASRESACQALGAALACFADRVLRRQPLAKRTPN